MGFGESGGPVAAWVSDLGGALEVGGCWVGTGVGAGCDSGGGGFVFGVAFSGAGVVRSGTEVVGVGGEGLESGGPVVGAEVVVGSDGVV